jgi:predicted transport protein
MFLYSNSKDSYTNVKSIPFDNEKDIQNIVENNMDTLLNLEFIESEFIVGDFRLDSVCLDPETNSFVIIEYKLDKNHALTDQGYSYLNTMMNNKSKFVLALSQKRNELFTEKDFNWKDSRVVFISQTFSKYQLNAFAKDLPFELVRIKKFESNDILLDHISPQYSESFSYSDSKSKTKNNNTGIDEFKKTTEEEHLSKLTDSKLLDLYNLIKERILDLGKYEVNVTSSYIGFRLDKFNNLVTIKTRKDKFSLNVVLGWVDKDGSKSPSYFELDDPKKVAVHKDWNSKNMGGSKGYRYYVVVDRKTSNEDLDYIMFLIKQKHNVFETVKI